MVNNGGIQEREKKKERENIEMRKDEKQGGV